METSSQWGFFYMMQQTKSIDNKTAEALVLLATYTQGITRLNGDTYTDYVLQIIEELKETPANSFTFLLTALVPLHDNIEAARHIKRQFGSEIVRSLQQYDKLTKLKFQTKTFSNEAAQMFLIIAHNPHVTLVRLAERIVNLKTASFLKQEMKDEIAQRAFTLYAPLAEIIGLQNYNNSIKRLALALTSRNHYLEAELIQQEYHPKLQPRLDATVDRLTAIAEDIAVAPTIHSRLKGIHSIHAKLQRYAQKPSRKDTEIGNFPMADLGAIRVLLENAHDCFTFFSHIQNACDIVVFDDYITHPKPNGYRAIHCIIAEDDLFFEIQIKTHAMHHHNEFGDASHFFYKLTNSIDLQTTKKKAHFGWVEQIHEWHQEVQNKAFEEIPYFKKNIYTLTPKGDIIVLPKGSIALDFAYAIHKQVGDQCERAFINDTLATLDQELQNGDVVRIHTNPKRKPHVKLFSQVKSRKARTMIRRSLQRTSTKP